MKNLLIVISFIFYLLISYIVQLTTLIISIDIINSNIFIVSTIVLAQIIWAKLFLYIMEKCQIY